MIISNFVNEVGNKIKIKIKKYNGNGVNHKTKESVKFKGVSVSIIGPTSEMENMITLDEAKKLYECLGEYLKSIE